MATAGTAIIRKLTIDISSAAFSRKMMASTSTTDMGSSNDRMTVMRASKSVDRTKMPTSQKGAKSASFVNVTG